MNRMFSKGRLGLGRLSGAARRIAGALVLGAVLSMGGGAV